MAGDNVTRAGGLRLSSMLGLALGILRSSATLASMQDRETLESSSENSLDGKAVNRANALEDAPADVLGGGATLTRLARNSVMRQVLGGELSDEGAGDDRTWRSRGESCAHPRGPDTS